MHLPHQHTIELQPVLPYDFSLSLQEVEQYPLDITERVIGNQLLRGLWIHTNPVLLSIRTDSETTLEIDIYAETQPDIDLIKKNIRQILNLDLDLEEWYLTIDSNDPMRHLIEDLWGFKPIAKPTIFESICSAILEQQLNVEFACTLETRLIQKYGIEVLNEEHSAWIFPLPGVLVNLQYYELKPLQFSSAKSEYIIDIARKITNGELDFESRRSLDDNSLLQELTSIRGVGQWTAEYVAMIGYQRFSQAPAADIGLRNAITTLTGSQTQLTEENTRAYMEQWAGYLGLATSYIWYAFSAGFI